MQCLVIFILVTVVANSSQQSTDHDRNNRVKNGLSKWDDSQEIFDSYEDERSYTDNKRLYSSKTNDHSNQYDEWQTSNADRYRQQQPKLGTKKPKLRVIYKKRHRTRNKSNVHTQSNRDSKFDGNTGRQQKIINKKSFRFKNRSHDDEKHETVKKELNKQRQVNSNSYERRTKTYRSSEHKDISHKESGELLDEQESITVPEVPNRQNALKEIQSASAAFIKMLVEKLCGQNEKNRLDLEPPDVTSDRVDKDAKLRTPHGKSEEVTRKSSHNTAEVSPERSDNTLENTSEILDRTVEVTADKEDKTAKATAEKKKLTAKQTEVTLERADVTTKSAKVRAEIADITSEKSDAATEIADVLNEPAEQADDVAEIADVSAHKVDVTPEREDNITDEIAKKVDETAELADGMGERFNATAKKIDATAERADVTAGGSDEAAERVDKTTDIAAEMADVTAEGADVTIAEGGNETVEKGDVTADKANLPPEKANKTAEVTTERTEKTAEVNAERVDNSAEGMVKNDDQMVKVTTERYDTATELTELDELLEVAAERENMPAEYHARPSDGENEQLVLPDLDQTAQVASEQADKTGMRTAQKTIVVAVPDKVIEATPKQSLELNNDEYWLKVNPKQHSDTISVSEHNQVNFYYHRLLLDFLAKQKLRAKESDKWKIDKLIDLTKNDNGNKNPELLYKYLLNQKIIDWDKLLYVKLDVEDTPETLQYYLLIKDSFERFRPDKENVAKFVSSLQNSNVKVHSKLLLLLSEILRNNAQESHDDPMVVNDIQKMQELLLHRIQLLYSDEVPLQDRKKIALIVKMLQNVKLKTPPRLRNTYLLEYIHSHEPNDIDWDEVFSSIREANNSKSLDENRNKDSKTSEMISNCDENYKKLRRTVDYILGLMNDKMRVEKLKINS